jgi:hypothetical protein
MNFHILINFEGLYYVTREIGGITSNILKLSKNYFDDFDFKSVHSNTRSGFVLKIDMKDFDVSYKILDSDCEIVIDYDDNNKKMRI